MKKIKNKKSIFIIIFLLVISSTVAYLYSTDTFQNIFVAASYKVTVTETFESPDNWKPGDTTPKTATLKNEGTVPIKVRVKLEESWKDSNNQDLPLQHNEENVAIINFSNEDDYIYKDGYYYYDLPLNPGETTSSIIESVTFNPNYSGTVTCVENDDSTHTCSSSESGYEGGTYKLTLTIEGVQEDYYVQAWGLPGVVERQYLYDVLKNESDNNGLARKYTGEHHDSFTEEPSKDIYHWYADNDSDGTLVQDKYNVIFADHCWHMYRTTDTGGVKMVYNGEVVDGQCLSTRGNHIGYRQLTTQTLSGNYWYGTDYTYDSVNKLFTISGTTEQAVWSDSTYQELTRKYTCMSENIDGTCASLYFVESYNNATTANVIPIVTNEQYYAIGRLQFNLNSTSPADVGYMYNTRYILNDRGTAFTERLLSSTSLGTNYWYAPSVVWGSPTANRYNLVSPYQVSSIDEYPNLVGKYTFRNANQNYTAASVNYIAGVSGNTMYYIQLGNSENHNLADINPTYTYGDSYTDNGDGTYTINNPTTINRSDWYNSFSDFSKYVCKNAVNNTCSDLWYTTSGSRTAFGYLKVDNYYKFASGFTYNENTGTYTLNSDSVNIWNVGDYSNRTILRNHRYTCWNKTGECTTLSYYHSVIGVETDSITDYRPYYINLTGGRSIEDALSEMLSDENVNKNDSIIKIGIEAWYKKYLLDYDNYLEETIYCNDRTIRNLSEWDPTGSDTSYLQFKNYIKTTDLSCTNITDRFSVSNSKAPLNYKVGLISEPEMHIFNNNTIGRIRRAFWLFSPNSFNPSDGASVSIVTSMGNFSSSSTSGAIRPTISLKAGIEYTDGDGSMANPYIVKTD